MNSKLSLFWGLFIFLASATLFSFSSYSSIASFYIFISMFCGIFLIVFRKDIPAFSPIFMLISSIYVNIGFSALYFLLNTAHFSEEMLKNISIIYIIYFISLALPVFFANQMFIPVRSMSEESEEKHKKSLFTLNFYPKNLNLYLFGSNLLIILLVLLLLKFTDFSYIEALKNPLNFRFAASAGILAYIRKLVFLLFMLNTFILAKYSFSRTVAEVQEFKLKTGLFTFFHIILLILFGIISGSRSIFILPVLSSIAIYSFYNRLKITTIISFSFIFVLTLSIISFYSAYRNHSKFNFSPQQISSTLSKINIITVPLHRLDSYKNSLYFFEYIDREYNTLYYFKDFHIINQVKEHIFQPFPRSMIPDKGHYFSSLMTEKVFNSELNESKITYNFGGISNAFWNFGIAGVLLEGLFLGIAVVWLHRRFLEFINYDSFFMFLMTTFFFIPNSIIVDGFWNTMDGCGYALNLLITGIVVFLVSTRFYRFKKV